MMESVRPREQRNLATMDSLKKESEVLIVQHSVENAVVKGMRFGDEKNALRKNQREKEGRKALKDVNRLHMYTAGPVKTIRPDTPIVKPHNRYRSLPPQNIKYFNPCAKYTKVSLALSKIPPKPQKQPPPKHLYGCLSIKKRSLPVSQDKTINVYEFHGSDSDDCIEISNENESEITAKASPAEERPINYGDMPILKKVKLEHQIVPDFSPKVLPKLEIVKDLKPKVRIREEKIYHEKNFNVEEFLKRSNNPHHYFLNPTRKCGFNSTSFRFLQNSFPNLTDQIVETVYELAHYNMSTTADYLNRMMISLKNSRKWHSVEAKNLSQLQEFRFITDLYKLPREKH